MEVRIRLALAGSHVRLGGSGDAGKAPKFRHVGDGTHDILCAADAGPPRAGVRIGAQRGAPRKSPGSTSVMRSTAQQILQPQLTGMAASVPWLLARRFAAAADPAHHRLLSQIEAGSSRGSGSAPCRATPEGAPAAETGTDPSGEEIPNVLECEPVGAVALPDKQHQVVAIDVEW